MVAVIVIVGIAFAATALWLGAAYVYIGLHVGWEAVPGLELSALSSLIAAVGAPLLALWLVAGFLGHLFTLRHQNRAIRQLLWQAQRANNQSEVTSRALVEMRQQARQSLFFQTMDMTLADLNGALATVAVRAGIVDEDAAAVLWSRYFAGDQQVFCRAIRAAADNDLGLVETIGKRVITTGRLRTDIQTYLFRYDRLIRLATEYDEQRFLLDLLQEGEHHRLQPVMAKACRPVLSDPVIVPVSPQVSFPPEEETRAEEDAATEVEAEENSLRLRARRRRGLFGVITGRPVSPLADALEPVNDAGTLFRPGDGDDRSSDVEDEEATRPVKPFDIRDTGGSARPFSPLTPDFPKQEGWPGDTGEP
ncbi:MAG: hypothetical protein ABT940_12975 [Alphaproteobacteria bacterium]